MKKCTNCQEDKPLSEFYNGSKSGKPTSWCKQCYRVANRSRSSVPTTRRHCESCGKEFTPRRVRSVTCSPACLTELRASREKAERRLKLKASTCEVCGKEYLPKSNKRVQRFCSRFCKNEALKVTLQEQRDARRKAAPVRYCRSCEVELPWDAPGHAVFCSETCQVRHHHLSKYGLTVKTKAAMLSEQGGGCAICGTTEPGSKGWVVDHDHSCCETRPTCGKCSRGVLCQPCNYALGHMADDPVRLRKAADYLESTSLTINS